MKYVDLSQNKSYIIICCIVRQLYFKVLVYTVHNMTDDAAMACDSLVTVATLDPGT